jgi:glutamate-1-semialdehyde 2,1-aminomutase
MNDLTPTIPHISPDAPAPCSLFERAQRVIPGGVNSPVRAFRSVGGDPIFVRRGKGSRIWTTDGRELVDFCGSWGPLILGHAREEVIEAITRAAADGTSFGISTEREVEFAELLCKMIPHIERVRLVSSGTEAVMTALRLGRGFTGRNRVIKFDGCYHGHSDAMLVAAGSGLLTGGIASSAGVPPGMTADVSVVPYNDLNAVKEVFRHCGNDIAAVIVEPVAANMGLVPPAEGFLNGLRDVTAQAGAVLIFDEVITGFRFGPTTYAAICGVTPDLVCLGKIIGGGMPIGAVAGRADIMGKLAPLGPVYQAGTLSGNPVAVAAGLATLQILGRENPYPRIARLTAELAAGIEDRARQRGVPLRCPHAASLFTPFFCADPVTCLADARHCDTQRFARFFHGLLDHGIYLPPSQFEVGFLSAAHTERDTSALLHAAECVWARDTEWGAP